MDTPAPQRRRNTQVITRAMIRELRERVAANPPAWLLPTLEASRTRSMQIVAQDDSQTTEPQPD